MSIKNLQTTNLLILTAATASTWRINSHVFTGQQMRQYITDCKAETHLLNQLTSTWLNWCCSFTRFWKGWYHTRLLRSLVSYRFEHSKINFISPCNHVLSSLSLTGSHGCLLIHTGFFNFAPILWSQKHKKAAINSLVWDRDEATATYLVTSCKDSQVHLGIQSFQRQLTSQSRQP